MADTGSVDEVIARARTGDSEALGQIWRAYNHLLLRYFRAKGAREPEDLASVVWVEVSSILPRFEGTEADFRRWLFTIAARRRIDDLRATTRRERRDEQVRATTPRPVAPAAGDEAERAEALDRAIEVIRQLPPDQAEAVLLRVVGDMSVPEVAEIMRRSPGSVRVLVHRGLERLRSASSVTPDGVETMYPS